MRNDIYTKYFEKRNNSLKDNNQDNNSRRVFETFNSALEYFNHDIIKKNDHLVDIGCGDRSFINFLQQVGINSSGYDINNGINFEIDKFPNIDNSVDHVVTNSVIEHIYNPNNFLSEIKRILKKNGNLIIVTPNFRFSYKEFYDDPTHVKPYTEESLKKILEMYEFYDIKILPWFVKKPKIYWKIPKKFFFGSLIPFRGDSSRLIPKFLKGQTKSILAICKK
jgi:ubiquinone/menaquinone biosynthesis C-methylase UbiE